MGSVHVLGNAAGHVHACDVELLLPSAGLPHQGGCLCRAPKLQSSSPSAGGPDMDAPFHIQGGGQGRLPLEQAQACHSRITMAWILCACSTSLSISMLH